MRLTTLLMLGAGYVMGARAGRERYAEIVTAAAKASQRLEDYTVAVAALQSPLGMKLDRVGWAIHALASPRRSGRAVALPPVVAGSQLEPQPGGRKSSAAGADSDRNVEAVVTAGRTVEPLRGFSCLMALPLVQRVP